jgi:hypothetical protein
MRGSAGPGPGWGQSRERVQSSHIGYLDGISVLHHQIYNRHWHFAIFTRYPNSSSMFLPSSLLDSLVVQLGTGLFPHYTISSSDPHISSPSPKVYRLPGLSGHQVIEAVR